MTVTPTGPLSLAKEAMRQTLADCPTWQALCEPYGGTVIERVYLDGLPPPKDIDAGYTKSEWLDLRPFAVVWTRGFGLTQEAEPGWSPSEYGSLGLRLWRSVDDYGVVDSEPSGDADTEWSNIVGGILSELSERSGGHSDGGDAFLAFHSIDCPDGFYCSAREESALTGVFQGVDLAISFGSGRSR